MSHLLKRTNCLHVLVSEDEYMQTLAREATSDIPGVILHSILNFDKIFKDGEVVTDDCGTEGLPNEFKIGDVGMILHSSGAFETVVRLSF